MAVGSSGDLQHCGIIYVVREVVPSTGARRETTVALLLKTVSASFLAGISISSCGDGFCRNKAKVEMLLGLLTSWWELPVEY